MFFPIFTKLNCKKKTLWCRLHDSITGNTHSEIGILVNGDCQFRHSLLSISYTRNPPTNNNLPGLGGLGGAALIVNIFKI